MRIRDDMSHFFIAFSGRRDDKLRKKTRISKQLSVWNLNKFSGEELPIELQKKIPLLSHLDPKERYKLDFLPKGVQLTWGLLVEDSFWGNNYGNKSEFTALCNLFSDVLLNPLFTVDNLGIWGWGLLKDHKKHSYWEQNKYELFATKNFARFYDVIKTETEYLVWGADYIERWIKVADKESWRIYLAHCLYKDLEKYDHGKNPYTYLKEVVDIAVILEILLTSKRERGIEKKLKLRSKSMLEEFFSSIEADIEDLYKDRSDFVHGNYFLEIAKNSRLNSEGNYVFPNIDFEKLKKYRNYLRHILVGYLFLNKNIRSKTIKASDAVSFVKMAQSDPRKKMEMKKTLKSILTLL